MPNQPVNHPEVNNVSHKFLIHKRGDHVGVAVADIQRGEHVQGVFMDDDSTIEINAHDAVPLGHKIAIADLVVDTSVIEYGIPIGTTVASISTGTYVHTHNLKSARW
jgi:(2R)-sulfolactate sulfo-lyase subunit alpha